MIHDPPLLTIRRGFQRPSAAALARFAGAQTGHLADAMDGRGALDAAIKPVDRRHGAFVGSAVTCASGPGDYLGILAALTIAEAGDVIICAGEGFAAAAIVGDNVAAMAQNRGVVAIVVDGYARDSVGIETVGLPIFARGLTPNSADRTGPGQVGQRIVIGGVVVESGDVVVGDIDGVVIVPRRRLDEVLARLADVREAETALQERIASGLDHLEVIDALLAEGRIRFVD